MSEGKKLGRPFTPETAPRAGGKPGRKAKLSAAALQILDKLMRDWKLHGASVLKILRVERPDVYAKLCLEASTRLGLAESVETMVNDVPTVLIVKWGDPSNPPAPPPPETVAKSSPYAPASTKLLSFTPPDA